ncbi:hypothetical protein G4D82_03880 [Flavobacterium sp. CYK-4]|uniref:DUF5777 family beta-barrel protein n=1 Tax=Flavobacterium lotistagni TaxID=2709660 RepID=UPI00140BFB38|nr:DUF5777 family beta-barrel protein [Flavobacterium lotistagni]NHM06349.1 hypothetical protein [Flavobacterium lotistagni]
MNINRYILLFVLFFAASNLIAQEDLLNQLDSIKPKEKQVAAAAFKGLQICNMQSTKLPVKGEWYFLVSHRFGDLKEGINNFFGLDNALTKIGGIYGATNWLSFSASRHTFNKTFELGAKYMLISQKDDGFPFTFVGYHTMDINSSKFDEEEFPEFKANNRFAYTSQLLISRKFSESVSLQVAPIWVHKNLYDAQPGTERKDQMLVSGGGRCKLSKRISFNLEYAFRINEPEKEMYHNPLTAGFDIETGGHVFQLVFSNSQAMNDVAYFTNATGKWNGGSLFFGFNMYRVF